MKKTAFILILSLSTGLVLAQTQTTTQLTREQQLAIETTVQEEMKVSGTPGASLALITELKQAGISVHAPIGAVIKGLSPGLTQLTYHQLLSHTSGMIDNRPASRLPGDILFEKDESGAVNFMRYSWASWKKAK